MSTQNDDNEMSTAAAVAWCIGALVILVLVAIWYSSTLPDKEPEPPVPACAPLCP